LKAIKQAKDEEEVEYKHDPSQFEFISAANKMKDVYNNSYYYSNKMQVNLDKNGMMIYKLDPEMSSSEKYIDAATSGLGGYAAFKAIRNVYGLALGTGGSPIYAGFWSLLAFSSGKFLADMYYRQVYFIDEVAIVGRDMDSIVVKTQLAGTYNLFANYRLAFWDKNLHKEYTFKISDCSLSDKDDTKSPILRV
jgi:hypothetical protein